jgi:hypothetical protein
VPFWLICEIKLFYILLGAGFFPYTLSKVVGGCLAPPPTPFVRIAMSKQYNKTISSLADNGYISMTELCGGMEVVRSMAKGSLQQLSTRLGLCLHTIYDALRAETSETPPPPLLITGDEADITKKVALHSVALYILEHGFIGYGEAAELYIGGCNSFVETVNSRYSLTIEGPSTSNMGRVQLLLPKELPVMKLPFRASRQTGKNPAVLVPNVPSILDEDLSAHLAPVFKFLKDE